ncbi:MAG: alpha/beta hydrolase [Alphaproteobacteria bacterium]
MVKVVAVELPTGVTVTYVESGDPAGVPVVCLHGYADSLRSFETMARAMPRSLRVIAYSQRGHGDATRPETGYRLADFATDALAFIDAIGLRKAVLVGHSMGSLVAQSLALDAPDRLSGMVLIGSAAAVTGNAPVQDLWQGTVRHLTDPVDPAFVRDFQTGTSATRIDPAFQEVVVAESMKLPARVWRETLGGLLDFDHTDALRRVKTPTLILWGDQDVLFSAADQERLRAALPHAVFTAYQGAGHNTQWEQPERVAKDVTRFALRLAR